MPRVINHRSIIDFATLQNVTMNYNLLAANLRTQSNYTIISSLKNVYFILMLYYIRFKILFETTKDFN